MSTPAANTNPGFIGALIEDGRPLLLLTAVCLILSGAFALFLSASGQFLPHDVEFLGMTASQLCGVQGCRVVHFMFHDRVSFGGSLIAVGLLYLWLVKFPLSNREPWAWWLLVFSGTVGFGSFLAYLGYGYLDTWHGAATLFLLPCFVVGLTMSRKVFSETPASIGCLLRPGNSLEWRSSFGIGRLCLLATALGMVAGGLTIMVVGMTTVFVPQDLKFMGLSPPELQSVNAHLIPLIAHDRAGFGGGICTCGLTVLFCVWCGTPSRSLWQALGLAGIAGFSTAIGIHPLVGYTDLGHLAPALAGAAIFVLGLLLTRRRMFATLGPSFEKISNE